MTKASKFPSFIIYLYFTCQSINLTAAVISVAVAAIVGVSLAPSPIYSTIPYGIQFLFLFAATYPVSILMKHKGRNYAFVLGAVFLFLSGIVGFIAVTDRSFTYLIVSHAFLGVFSACANYYRFAVTDSLEASKKSKALSLVVAGGVIAGLIGPILSSNLKEISGFASFSMCYGFFSVLSIINIFIIIFLPKNTTSNDKKVMKPHNSIKIDRIRLWVAIIAASLGYGLMNLAMIQSSLHMHNHDYSFHHSSVAIQWHVIAMFLPSFFSGYLISKFSHYAIILTGFILFIISSIINITLTDYYSMVFSLVVLGVAWNFTYVGGSSLIAVSLGNTNDRSRWQGIGDSIIAMLAALGALLPSFLMSLIGWFGTNLLVIFLSLIFVYFSSMYYKIKFISYKYR